MDLKTYEKTRWQNIYRHKKNKNYVIMISKPIKTSVSRIEGKKIFDKEQAIKIRDTYKPNISTYRNINTDFDTLYLKYIDNCEMVQKLAYNTILKKKRVYNRYFKNKFTKKINKINKNDIVKLVNYSECSEKQKNLLITQLKSFFNWCIKEEIIYVSPILNMPLYKVSKNEMKYWTPNNLKKFLSTLNEDIKNWETKEVAYRIKLLTLISFSLGCRIGETRSLSFNSFDIENKKVNILHSINYDNKNNNYVKTTKTYHSQREVDITEKLINEVLQYKDFLINEMLYDVKDDSLIFFNYSKNRPFSDTALRKQFYKYCDKAKVPKIRMYDLRHTYVATMMAEGKELYHISKRIGHINYNTTVNKYGHLSDNIKQEIAKTTDKYF